MSYAEGTTVTVEESQEGLRGLLTRHRATGIQIGRNTKGDDVVRFSMRGKEVRMKFTPEPGQKHRSQWRAFLLLMKAKLECAESGLSSFESEFMLHFGLPNGTTVLKTMGERVNRTITSGDMRALTA